MSDLKWLASVVLLGASAVSGQVGSGPVKSPQETIDLMWKQATAGEFLGVQGCKRYSSFFLHPSTCQAKSIYVVSNSWSVLSASIKGSDAEVDVDYTDAGRINANLTFSPPRKTAYYKTAVVYHLVLAPTRLPMFSPDGKEITAKTDKPTPTAWQITNEQGYPFVTVNTAIRYLLEVRRNTADPALRKNADETLSKLLRIN